MANKQVMYYSDYEIKLDDSIVCFYKKLPKDKNDFLEIRINKKCITIIKHNATGIEKEEKFLTSYKGAKYNQNIAGNLESRLHIHLDKLFNAFLIGSDTLIKNYLHTFLLHKKSYDIENNKRINGLTNHQMIEKIEQDIVRYKKVITNLEQQIETLKIQNGKNNNK